MFLPVNEWIKYNPVEHRHQKASERYIEVIMVYPDGGLFNGWIPIEYRRTGLNLKTNTEIVDYLNEIYPHLNPKKAQSWYDEAEKYWNEEKPGATETKKVFDAIKSGEWVCINCAISNPNWARRFQDIKEFGFTFATRTPVNCPVCGKKSTYVMAVHIPRADGSGNGYETWSPELRKRIIRTLHSYDAYEGKTGTNLLPDHKFSEIRWDESTKSVNPNGMTDDEIRKKFQLLSNQRNQQKREVCRQCFQTGHRPTIFGIDFYYAGDETWPEEIPVRGKEAEDGCYGCPWYDIEAWREALGDVLSDMVNASEKKK